MEEIIRELDQLLKQSGKEPNQEQKKQYHKAIYFLLNEYGFTETVQEYMIRGFKFIKMVPFKTYFIKKEKTEKENLLKQLFENKFLKKDKVRAFTILINLLALFIYSKVDYCYCRAVVREILKYSYNKDGNILGNANGAMLSNFYSDLRAVPDNFAYEKLFDDEGVRTQFEELLSNSVEYVSSGRKLTVPQQYVLDVVREWIPVEKVPVPINTSDENRKNSDAPAEAGDQTDSPVPEEDAAPAAAETDAGGENVKNDKKQNEPSDDQTCSAVPEKSEPEKKDEHKDNGASSETRMPVLFENLSNKLNRINSSVERNSSNIMILLRDQKQQLLRLDNALEREKVNSDYIRRRNIELSEEGKALQKNVNELRKQLAEKEEEVRSLKAMLDVSSKEGDRKFTEVILKLTEELRFEYEDYMTVRNHAMSIDLGENMRGQLGDIFAILKKAGLEIDK